MTYSFVATNTGNVTLSGVAITDQLDGLWALDCNPATAATLAPTDTLTCTATYAATQADVDAGTILNLATVTGTPPTGAAVSDEDGATVTIGAAPAIDLVKTASPRNGGAVGDLITYTLVATNAGNGWLTGVQITDPLAGLSDLTCDQSAPVALASTEALTCTATYRLTQADLDHGELVNTATVSGNPPGDATPVSSSDTQVLSIQQHQAIDFTKTANTDRVKAGDVITYTMTGANTGDVTLTDVRVDDPMNGLSDFARTPTQPAVLAPGRSAHLHRVVHHDRGGQAVADERQLHDAALPNRNRRARGDGCPRLDADRVQRG